MSRSRQRQGYVVASICKATPLPGKSPLAAQLISSFGDSFSNLVCTSSRKYLARLKRHSVRIYESHATVSLSPRLAVQVPPILVSNTRKRLILTSGRVLHGGRPQILRSLVTFAYETPVLPI